MAKGIAASNEKARNERDAKNTATGLLLANQYADMNEKILATSVAELVDAKRGTNGGGVATFVDQTDDIEESGHAIIPTVPLQGVYAAGLEDYLRRPNKIYAYNWDITGSTLSFEPYDLLLSDLPFTRKVCNFYKITFGGLDIKIVTNGTPYLYGAYFLGFWPGFVVDPFATTYARSSPTCISTKPCFTTIDPSADSVRYMAIPEVYPKEIVLESNNNDIGSIVGCVGAGLQSATSAGTTQYCYMTFYASARNPKVEFNTTRKPYHGTADEYKGKVSAPLAKLSKYSNMLSTVPIIGQYATSVAEASKLGAKAASMFGFAKPLDIEGRSTIKIKSNSNIPNSDGIDSSTSLALSKSALTTIDPTLMGLSSNDEMALSYILNQWSMATPFTWADTNVVNDNLYDDFIIPNIGYLGTYPCAQTNIGFVSNFFKYWRGSIQLKFVFNVSKFHTGRVQIVYEPSYHGALTSSDPTNVTQNVIVDLSDKTEVEMTIPYSCYKPLCKTLNDGSQLWGHSASVTPDACNGKIDVNVLSPLRAGSVATSVTVHVYVKAGPDYELFQPSLASSRNSTVLMTYQASGLPGTAPTNTGYSYMGTSDNSVKSDTDNPIVSTMCASERILSFRELGKRYTATDLITTKLNTNTLGVSYICTRDFPHQPGYSVTGSGSGSTQLLYYNNPHSLFTALGPAFYGWRGSIRTKLIPLTKMNSNFITMRATDGCSNYMQGATTLDVVSLGKYFSRTMDGAELTKVNIPYYFGSSSENTGAGDPIEISNPWVNPNKFEIVGDYCNDYGQGQGLVHCYFNTFNGLAAATFLKMQAFGDDFSFVFYKGPPILYQTTIA